MIRGKRRRCSDAVAVRPVRTIERVATVLLSVLLELGVERLVALDDGGAIATARFGAVGPLGAGHGASSLLHGDEWRPS